MANYQSSYTGAQHDAVIGEVSRLLAGGGGVTQNEFNDFSTNRVAALEEIIFSRVRYNASGDVSFTGWIPFNTEEINIGATWSNGQFVCTKAGIYIANFTNYSNSMTTGRTAVAHLNSSGTQLEMNMVNQNQSTSITAIYKCSVGDKIVAGAYASNFPVSIYSAAGHNEFTVFKLANINS